MSYREGLVYIHVTGNACVSGAGLRSARTGGGTALVGLPTVGNTPPVLAIYPCITVTIQGYMAYLTGVSTGNAPRPFPWSWTITIGPGEPRAHFQWYIVVDPWIATVIQG